MWKSDFMRGFFFAVQITGKSFLLKSDVSLFEASYLNIFEF